MAREPKINRLEIGDYALPHDYDAERAVLSSAMSSDRQRGDAINAGLRAEHFYHPSHSTLWTAILDLDATNSVDVTAIGSRLTQSNQLHELTDPNDDMTRGVRYLGKLSVLAAHSTLAGRYAADLVSLATRRKVTVAAQTIAGEGYAGERRGEEFIGWALEQVQRATEEIEHADTMDSLAGIAVERVEDIGRWWSGEIDPHGLPLPRVLPELDRDLHGLALGEVSFIAAGTGVGKSVFGSQAAVHIARTPYHGAGAGVLYLTLEMPKAMVFDRVVCHLAEIPFSAYRTGRDARGISIQEDADAIDRLSNATRVVREMPFLVDDSDQDLGRVRLSIRRAQMRLARKGVKLRLVVIDHVHIMQMPDAERLDIAIADTVREFKRIAVEMDLHLMVLAQFSREVSKKDQRPSITDIKNSSAIEQIADKIILIHRPYVGMKDKTSNEAKAIKDDAEIIVGKHRNGTLGVFPAKFRGDKFAFEEERQHG